MALISFWTEGELRGGEKGTRVEKMRVKGDQEGHQKEEVEKGRKGGHWVKNQFLKHDWLLKKTFVRISRWMTALR